MCTTFEGSCPNCGTAVKVVSTKGSVLGAIQCCPNPTCRLELWLESTEDEGWLMDWLWASDLEMSVEELDLTKPFVWMPPDRREIIYEAPVHT